MLIGFGNFGMINVIVFLVDGCWLVVGGDVVMCNGSVFDKLGVIFF